MELRPSPPSAVRSPDLALASKPLPRRGDTGATTSPKDLATKQQQNRDDVLTVVAAEALDAEPSPSPDPATPRPARVLYRGEERHRAATPVFDRNLA